MRAGNIHFRAALYGRRDVIRVSNVSIECDHTGGRAHSTPGEPVSRPDHDTLAPTREQRLRKLVWPWVIGVCTRRRHIAHPGTAGQVYLESRSRASIDRVHKNADVGVRPRSPGSKSKIQ